MENDRELEQTIHQARGQYHNRQNRARHEAWLFCGNGGNVVWCEEGVFRRRENKGRYRECRIRNKREEKEYQGKRY